MGLQALEDMGDALDAFILNGHSLKERWYVIALAYVPLRGARHTRKTFNLHVVDFEPHGHVS